MRRIPRFACTVAATVMVSLIGSASIARAAYLRNVPQVLSQPDGTVVECLASGDEYFNFWHDCAGYVIVRDPASGWLVYAAKVDGEIRPSAHVVGVVDPANVKLVPGIKPDPSYVRNRRSIFAAPAQEATTAPGPAPSLPQINNVVIFIRFSDEGEFTDSSARYEGMFNATTIGANSLTNYFNENSYGTVTVTGTIIPAAGGGIVSYQDNHPRSYYLPYDATTNPAGYADSELGERELALLRKAVEWTASDVPASLVIDSNGDGDVDNVCFVVRGEAAGWSSLLWPHRSAMWFEEPLFIRGKRVSDYILITEDSTQTGVFAHEIGHTLGAPDLYHYNSCSSAPDLSPVGPWDLMAWDQDPPQHSTAYLKWRHYGFLGPIPEIRQSGTYTLNPITSPTNNAYRIASPNSDDEYFVVEYRRRTGAFESSLPDSGLLVYRINGTRAGYGNRCGPPDEVYVYRPGGSTTADGDVWSAALSSATGHTAINDASDPSSFLSDGYAGGLSISEVSASGATISFKVTLGTGCQRPTAFALNSPPNRSVLSAGTTSVLLTWAAADGADEYGVYAGATDDPPFVGSTNSTTYSLNVSTGITYWRVVTRNACGPRPSSPSGVWWFAIADAPGEVTLLADNFEGPFPGTRDVGASGTATGWGKSTYRAKGGAASAWCAGGGKEPQPPGSSYLPNMYTWMEYGPFSFADAAAVRLEFDLWATTESAYDLVQVIEQNDFGGGGEIFSTNTGGWIHKTMQLALVGQPRVFVGFWFSSNTTVEFEGAYIDNVVITKVVGAVCTLSCFPTVPPTGTAGQPVDFSASVESAGCTGSPSYSWTFGDGVTSTQLGPSHAYAAAGIYNWTLTVSQNGQSCTKNGSITITGGATQYVYWIPSAAHAPGAQGSKWRSDISVVNRSGSTANLTLVFVPYASGSNITRNRSLASNHTAEWSDVLVSLFGLGDSSNAKGTVKITSDAQLVALSRTYNQTASGTFGQYYPALTQVQAITASQAAVLPLLRKNAGFRTNVGFQNLSAASCTGEIKLFNGGGVQVGTTRTLTASDNKYIQEDDIFAKAGAGSQDVAYARVQPTTTGCKAWFFASVVDTATNDPTTVPQVLNVGGPYWIPSVAHAPGALGSKWRSDISIVHRAGGTANLTLEFIPYGSGATVTRTHALANNNAIEWDDVLVSLFGSADAANTKGTIKITSDKAIFGLARTYNQATSGTFGQYYPMLTATQGIARGRAAILPLLRKSAAFRTNGGYQDLGASSCTGTIRLFNATGVQVGSTRTLSAAPNKYIQDDDIFAKAGTGNQQPAYAVVEVTSTDGKAWFFGSVIDGNTNDPTTVPQQP